MEIISLREYLWLNDLVNTCSLVSEGDISFPSFGDIWLCRVPVLINCKKNLYFRSVLRPVLVVDDRHGHFVKNDSRNYYCLKITSQYDSYMRIKLNNYRTLGLNKLSYLRIELPLKIEYEQFVLKIGVMSFKEALKYIDMVKKVLKL